MHNVMRPTLTDRNPARKIDSRCLLGALICMIFVSGCAGPRDTRRTFKTVVIDAGHGGFDNGTASRRGGREKVATLDVAKRVEARLKQAGFRTVMTRESDEFIPLDRRAAISNRQRNALFVSIHFNDAPARRIRGIETYYHDRMGAEVADRIQKHLTTLPQASDRGVKHANFRVLRLSRYPAVLVECGFLSNPAEASLCASDGYRERLAEKITDALVEQRYGPNSAQAARVAGLP